MKTNKIKFKLGFLTKAQAEYFLNIMFENSSLAVKRDRKDFKITQTPCKYWIPEFQIYDTFIEEL